jgi:hypothetical protein
MATAKNCALDVLRRERTAFAPELGRLLESEWTLAPVVAGANRCFIELKLAFDRIVQPGTTAYR